jgi:hypothetical protein
MAERLMKPLEEMTVGQRIALTVVICLIILFALALAGYLTGGWDEAGAAPDMPVVASKWDDHIDTLERQAIDEAFKRYIGKLYDIWVSDNYQPKIPPKALVGARNARDAYIRSMDAIEKRELPPRAK